MSIEHDKRLQSNPVVSWGNEEDGAVLYNPDTDITSVINLSGHELWVFLDTPRTTYEIIKPLFQIYSDVTIEQATSDVELFIESLAPDFLLEIINGN